MQQSLPAILKELKVNQSYTDSILRQGYMYNVKRRLEISSGMRFSGYSDRERMTCTLVKVRG